jgi:hypothetical protein
VVRSIRHATPAAWTRVVRVCRVDCFCGCGRKVARFPLGIRYANWRGRRISKAVAPIENLLDDGLRSPNAAEFVQEGHELQEAIASAVHTGRDPGPEVKAASRKFLTTARESFNTERIGDAVLSSGMGPEGAFKAMTRGEFDPFAE